MRQAGIVRRTRSWVNRQLMRLVGYHRIMDGHWNETSWEPVANEKALRDLEFDRLRAAVRSYASSSLGEEAIDGLAPVADRDWIESAIEEVSEAIRYL